MKFSLCILVLFLPDNDAQRPKIWGEDLLSAKHLLNMTADIIKDTDRRVGLLLTLKKQSSECAAFEIGYLTYNIQEKYRRMVDKYNTSSYMKTRLYLMEHIIYLEEIERQYWDILHMANMLHEIERKYKIDSSIFEDYEETTPSERLIGTAPADYMDIKAKKEKKRTKFKMDKYLVARLSSTPGRIRKKKKKWPREYGWEIDYPEVGFYQ